MSEVITPAGFTDPAMESQRAFRAVLKAFSGPGLIGEVPFAETPPAPLMAGTAGFALTIFDLTTPVWLDDHMIVPPVRQYLSFHTNCPQVTEPAEAAYAVLSGPQDMADFRRFAQGTPEYPDRSTTLLIQVEDLIAADGVRLKGPGIETEHRLHVGGTDTAFWAAVQANHARFPLGVDIVFVAGSRIACLPRSITVEV